MPRSRSTAIQSERTRRRSPRALTSPASWIAPPNSSNFSVNVVLTTISIDVIPFTIDKDPWGLGILGDAAKRDVRPQQPDSRCGYQWRCYQRTATLRYVLALMGLGPAGCSSMPNFDVPQEIQDNTRAPTVAQIIDKVQCEIAEARDDPLNNSPELNQFLQDNGLAPFGQWVASNTLNLTVQDTGGLSPTSGVSLAYIDPLRLIPLSQVRQHLGLAGEI
jgi:hypothetical protein